MMGIFLYLTLAGMVENFADSMKNSLTKIGFLADEIVVQYSEQIDKNKEQMTFFIR